MPHFQYRFAYYDNEGKRHTKSISLDKYTEEQCRVIENLWRSHIAEGKNKDSFVFPEFEAKPSNEPNFPHCKLTDIEYPNNGGLSFLMLGSTRSGKSTAMLAVYETFFKKHVSILMTHSNHAEIYKPLQKNCAISPDFFGELIDDAMTINKHTHNKYPILFIFDDLALTGKNDPSTTKLLTIGRNSNLSAIIAGQRLEMLNPTGRTNCNIVCLFKLNTDSAIEDVIKTYLRSYFPTAIRMQEMITYYRKVTANHSFFLVNTLMDTVHICKINVDEE
jgi:hypothetical protein